MKCSHPRFYGTSMHILAILSYTCNIRVKSSNVYRFNAIFPPFIDPLFHNRDLHYHGHHGDETWRKDEMLAAKIKKFLTVSWAQERWSSRQTRVDDQHYRMLYSVLCISVLCWEWISTIYCFQSILFWFPQIYILVLMLLLLYIMCSQKLCL